MASQIAQPAPSPSAPPPREKRRHPVWKWIGRLLLALLALIILAAIVIQIVLWTSFPKSMVVSEVEKGLGLRIGVSGLSTGWLGHTTMTGVKLALPLSEQSFLDVPKMKVSHTNLLALLLGWPIQIKRLELDGAVIYVRQNAAGQWNLQQVAELIARAGGKRTGEQTSQASSTPALPWLRITNLTAHILDNHHRQLQITPVNVNGEPETPLSWKYDVEIPSGQANVPPHLSFLGRVAPGGVWAHEAHLWVHDIAAWVRPWKPGFDETIAFDGHWSGELTADGLHGFLQIADSQYGGYHAAGALGAFHSGGTITISADNLKLATPIAMLSDLRVATGQLAYNGKVLTARQVQLALLGGPATFNGWFEPDIHQGALEAAWQNVSVPKSGITQSGKLDLTYANPPAANLTLKLTVNDSGAAPQGPFEAVATLAATGQKLSDLTWTLNAPNLAWHRPEPVILDGLTAGGIYHQDAQHQLVRMEHVSLSAGNGLAGNGYYDLRTKQGELHVNGRDFPMRLLRGTPVAFDIDATGSGVQSPKDPKATVALIQLDQFLLHSGNASLNFTGKYDGREPKPVAAKVTFLNEPGPISTAGKTDLIRGHVSGSATLTGILSPMNVDIHGSLSGHNATILGHRIGDLKTDLYGDIDPQKAFIRADAIPFLGGAWNLGATHVGEQDGKFVDTTEIALSVVHLPLQRVSQFFQARPIQGTFQGSWYLYFPGLKPDPRRLVLTGGATIRQFADSAFKADEITFKTSLDNGVFKVDPVQVRAGKYGRIDAHAQFAINQWRDIQAAATLTAFPLDFSSASLQLWGGSDQIQVLLPDAHAKDAAARKLRINTGVRLRAGVSINQQPQGEVRLVAAMRGRVAGLQQLNGDVLGGHISAAGAADLDRPMQSHATFLWDKIDSAKIVRLLPQLKGAAGTYSGNARLQPATEPRPLEPLSLDVYLHSAKAHWRTVQIGDGQLHAYIGPHRFIASNRAPTSLQIAGGTLGFWFSASQHLDVSATANGQERVTGVTISNLLNLTLNKISIDQCVRAVDPTHPLGLGYISGPINTLSAPKTTQLAEIATEATYLPPPTTRSGGVPIGPKQEDMLQRILRTTTVDGKLRIEQSDLGNYGPIAVLYNLMHLGGSVRAPTGHGTIAFHMEQGTLDIPNLYYFNRGIEVRGVATATQMWNLPNNPIQGSAVGTARPLKSIKLPLFAEADAILSGLQGQLTSVEFKGTVKNPVKDYIRQLGLSQLGGELRQLLLGEAGANRGQ